MRSAQLAEVDPFDSTRESEAFMHPRAGLDSADDDKTTAPLRRACHGDGGARLPTFPDWRFVMQRIAHPSGPRIAQSFPVKD